VDRDPPAVLDGSLEPVEYRAQVIGIGSQATTFCIRACAISCNVRITL
jgi:hypothetical protein